MKKDNVIIIVAIIAVVIGGISIIFSESESISKIFDFRGLETHGYPDAISSGPLTITKSKYKIYENIFFIVDGLKENEKGRIIFLTPDGRVYKTTVYDGSIKSGFNLYFRPDTSVITKFCEQEEFVGEWTAKFDNNAFPPLKFEIINEHIGGEGYRLNKAC
ncbi:MAG: hypothetical protein R3321_12135 [Nitrososphaeraceae archaeon]|nr:hypothetical protein [Nitrososphaeraceae archaeon]